LNNGGNVFETHLGDEDSADKYVDGLSRNKESQSDALSLISISPFSSSSCFCSGFEFEDKMLSFNFSCTSCRSGKANAAVFPEPIKIKFHNSLS